VSTTKPKNSRGWAYVGALLGGSVSTAANVAHSYVPPDGAPAGWSPHPGAVIGAVVWPIALFVAVEIFARYSWPDGTRWTALRFLGLLPVALVAAFVSYRHLSGLLTYYREDPLTAALGPLAIDGLMVMATGALIAAGPRHAPTTSAVDLVSVAPAAPGVPPVTDAAEPASGVSDTSEKPASDTTAKRPARRVSSRPDTALAIARLRARRPDITATELAQRLKVSDRTVRRHLNAPTSTTGDASPLAV
jgi:DNA-binding transcriptional ArsR family regulator